jgi:hypothetical protein
MENAEAKSNTHIALKFLQSQLHSSIHVGGYSIKQKGGTHVPIGMEWTSN